MILGIGTDLVSIPRMRDALRRHGTRLIARLLHPEESRALDAVTDKGAFLARRFAAKEAVSKAFGTGIGSQVRLAEIEIIHDTVGRPLLRFHGHTAETALARGVGTAHLSVSDEHEYALAFVVLLTE